MSHEAMDLRAKPLALYIHIPFCKSKCPYCDFNTYEGIEPLIPSYVDALSSEIEIWGDRLGGPAVHTIFLGGGTPSYLPAEAVGGLLDTVRRAFDLEPMAEITLEANPDDCTTPSLRLHGASGVNRISIGVQSLDDRLLAILGRRHDAAQAVDAYRAAREAGFENVSVDLMYGLPEQTIGDWRRTLDALSEIAPPHASLYCLAIEKGTPMERWVDSGALPEPDPDLAAEMYELAEEAMARREYRHYEISNWALPGFESRHNLVYWRNEPYLGVGPGAHSYLDGVRFWNLRSPREYVRRVERAASRDSPGKAGFPSPGPSLSLPPRSRGKGRMGAPLAGPAVEGSERIDRGLESAETLMLGLRLDEGVSSDEFAARFGEPPSSIYAGVVSELSGLGLLEESRGSLRLTRRGRILSNEVFSRLLSAEHAP